MKNFLYIIGFLITSNPSEIPKRYLKKIDKEVLSVFEIDQYEKEPITFDEDVKAQFSPSFDPNSFFRIRFDEESIGYFYFGTAASKADDFDYLVIFDEEMTVMKIKILAYREDYGGEISSKRWLRQFNGLKGADEVFYGDDIIAISGATISAVSMTDAVNDLLKNVALIPLEK